MALKFTGSGQVDIPSITLTGDFSITGTFEYFGSTQIVLGDTAGLDSYIAPASASRFQFKFAGVTINVTSSFVVGTKYSFSAVRSGSTITCIADGVQSQGASSGPVTFNVFGQGDNQFFYTRKASGSWVISGAGVNTRTYNFNQTPGDTVLPDTTDFQDGNFSGDFTGGGFDGIGETITITSINDYECKQRDGSNQALFTIAGTTSAQATVVEYQLDIGAWSVLDAAPTATTFTGSVTVTGQQSVSVRYSNDVGITDTKQYVSAAACVPATWQSNEEGVGINNQVVTAGAIQPIMHRSGVFAALIDPVNEAPEAKGSMWPHLAKAYADDGVVLCVKNLAVGGTKIDEWQKTAVPSTYYDSITSFHNIVGGFEFTTSVGGENDSEDGTGTATMTTLLTQFCTDLNTDFGTTHYLTYFPIGDGLSATPQDIADTRTAFDNVVSSNAFVRFGGDLSVIDIDIATAGGNDGLHLKQDADLITGAGIRFDAFTGTQLSIVTVGAPDGTYDTILWDDSLQVVYSGTIDVVSDTVSVFVTAPAGTLVRGASYDNTDPSSDGMWIQGTTV